AAQPDAQGGLLLDLAVVADDRLADAADQGARPEALLQSRGEGVRPFGVVRREEDNGKVRPLHVAGQGGTDLVQRGGTCRESGGKGHGNLGVRRAARGAGLESCPTSLFYGARGSFNSSSLTLTARPFAGIGTSSVHSTPCATRRRYSSRRQLS